MEHRHRLCGLVVAALCAAAASTCGAQLRGQRADNGNRLNNPFRPQFKPAWTLPVQDPVKLIDIGPVTDAKRSNLVLLVGGRTATDTQRKLRVMHWNGSGYDLDGESVSQSIGTDTLLIGHFHPGAPAPEVAPVIPATGKAKAPKRRAAPHAGGEQILTNAGIYVWSDGSLVPILARQLPDVKQAIILDNRSDLVVVGAGEGALPFEFTQTEMRPAAREKLQGGGYAHFGIGLQPFAGADKADLAPGIRFAQATWSGRNKWVIGLVRGQAAATTDDPAATTGDRVVVYSPKFASRDKTFWETRMDDLEEAWRSDPLPGRVLDVRVGDPHNDGKVGILVLTSENSDRDRRLTFYALSGTG
jgi:hypothetical protein